MDIYFKDQHQYLPQHLDALLGKSVISYDKAKLRENTTSIEIESTIAWSAINFDFFFGYQVFPGNIMSSLTQWVREGRPMMKVGDTIVQQVYIPPMPKLSQKLIFGVRIREIIDEVDRKGYSYETIIGHVEKGISIFSIERKASGKILFSIRTFSEPATFLTKLLGSVFSLPYQAYCTKRTLENVKHIIESRR